MKIWNGYGSEHSANLVMIGQFKDISKAVKAERAFELLTQQVRADEEAHHISSGERSEHFTEGMSSLLRELQLYIIGAAEVEQFAYDVHVERQGTQVVIKTDEYDVSAFFKVLLDNQARIEIYSAHNYSEEEQDPGN